MNKNHKTQVREGHYLKGYDSLNRFISYFYQTKSILELNVKSVLEVGVGNKTVNNYLKSRGLDVKSVDFDKNLKPDVVADVRKMPLKNKQFDAVLCCEVLEHIPLDELPKALRELTRVSKKYVIVSVPYYCAYFELFGKFSFGHFTKALNFAFSIPYFFLKPKFSGEHYWGLGVKGISKRCFRKHAKKVGLKVIKEFRETLNPHHYFFVMKRKRN